MICGSGPGWKFDDVLSGSLFLLGALLYGVDFPLGEVFGNLEIGYGPQIKLGMGKTFSP